MNKSPLTECSSHVNSGSRPAAMVQSTLDLLTTGPKHLDAYLITLVYVLCCFSFAYLLTSFAFPRIRLIRYHKTLFKISQSYLTGALFALFLAQFALYPLYAAFAHKLFKKLTAHPYFVMLLQQFGYVSKNMVPRNSVLANAYEKLTSKSLNPLAYQALIYVEDSLSIFRGALNANSYTDFFDVFARAYRTFAFVDFKLSMAPLRELWSKLTATFAASENNSILHQLRDILSRIEDCGVLQASKLFEAFVDLLSVFVVAPTLVGQGMSFDKSSLKDVKTRTASLIRKTDSWSSWMEMVVSLAKSCLDGTICLVDGKIARWSHHSSAYGDWIKDVNDYELTTENIDKVSMEAAVNIVKYKLHGRDLVLQGREILTKLNLKQEKPALTLSIKHYLSVASKCHSVWVQRYGSSKYREQPLAAGITGPVGIGKTSLMNFIHTYYINFQNAWPQRPYIDPNQAPFFPNQTDNFDSDFTPDKKVFILDDVQTVNPKLVPDRPWLQFVKVVNHVPVQANMARLEDKGEYYMEPALVIVTSNDSEFFSKHVFLNKPAVLRRFTFQMRVLVKAEFQNELKHLDMGHKVALSPGEDTFPWEIKFGQWSQVPGSTNMVFDVQHVVTERREFEVVLKEYFTQHIQMVTRMTAQLNEPRIMNLCSQCKVPSCVCDAAPCSAIERFRRRIRRSHYAFRWFSWGLAIDHDFIVGDIQESSVGIHTWYDWFSCFVGGLINPVAHFASSRVVTGLNRYFSFYFPEADYTHNGVAHFHECTIPTPNYIDYIMCLNLVTMKLWAYSGYSNYFNAIFCEAPSCNVCMNCQFLGSFHETIQSPNFIMWMWSWVTITGVPLSPQLFFTCCYISLINKSNIYTYFNYIIGFITRTPFFNDPFSLSFTPSESVFFDVPTVALCCITALFVGERLYKGKTFDPDTLPPEEREALYGTEKTRVEASPVTGPFKFTKRDPWSTYSVTDIPERLRGRNCDSTLKLLRKSYAKISVVRDDGNSIANVAISLGGGFWLTVKHTFPPEPSSTYFCALLRDGEQTCFVTRPFFTNHDLCVFYGPLLVDSVLDFFPKTLQDSPNKFNCLSELQMRTGPAVVKGLAQFVVEPPWTHLPLEVRNTFLFETKDGHPISKVHGSCGSLLYKVFDNDIIVPIGVLQVAAHDGHQLGYVPITFSRVLDLRSQAVSQLMKLKPAVPVFDLLDGCFGTQTKLGLLHPRSFLNYMDINQERIRIVGSFGGKGFRPSSKTYKTSIYDDVVALVPSVAVFKKPHFGTPQVNGVYHNEESPTFINFTALNVKNDKIPRALFLESALEYMSAFPWTGDKPLSLIEAINGRNLPHLKCISMSTSMGFPTKGDKSKFFTFTEDKGYIPGSSFTKVFVELDKMIRNGKKPLLPFNGTFKDEPIKKKTRLFAAAMAHLTLLLRRYFGHALNFFHNPENIHITLSAIGLDCYTQWNVVADFLLRHGEDKCGAADYSNYDKTISSYSIKTCFWLLTEHFGVGYSKQDKIACYTLGEIISEHYLHFNGDLVQVLGTNPSGQALTTVINSMVNAIRFHCFWKRICGPKNFRRNVSLVTYGDDVVFSTKDNKFTLYEIIKTAKSFDIKMTLASKEQATPEHTFEHITEIDFLNRRFVPVSGKWLCPLSLRSLGKMAAWATQKSSITELERAQDVHKALEKEAEQQTGEELEIVNKIIKLVEGQLVL